MNWLSKLIFFKLLGWTRKGPPQEVPPKCVIIIVPHTSWHDFYIGALVRRILNLQVNFVAKKELFRPPLGWYLRWMGGYPLDRTPGQRKVEAIAQIMQRNKHLRLAIAPEGTRKKVTHWKTGFYYIAREAQVPIVMVALDYSKKTVKISSSFHPTKDKASDFQFMHSFYKGAVGKVPENSW